MPRLLGERGLRGIDNDGISSNLIDGNGGEDRGDRSDDLIIGGGGGIGGRSHGNGLVQKCVIVIVDVRVFMLVGVMIVLVIVLMAVLVRVMIVMIVLVRMFVLVGVMLVMMGESHNFFLASFLNLLALLIDLDQTTVLRSFTLVVTSEGLALALHNATRVSLQYVQGVNFQTELGAIVLRVNGSFVCQELTIGTKFEQVRTIRRRFAT